MSTSEERPWWWPELTDDAWCEKTRDEYPDSLTELTNDEIREEYADGLKYANTWDNVGDAVEEHERLADAFLTLVKKYNLSPRDFED